MRFVLLVCNHTFHQNCVDPWLLNHRHCPLCNLDILAAYRVTVPTRNRRCSVAPQTPRVSYSSPMVTTAGRSVTEPTRLQRDEQQQTIIQMQFQPIPTISAAIRDDGVRIVALHSEQASPSNRSESGRRE